MSDKTAQSRLGIITSIRPRMTSKTLLEVAMLAMIVILAVVFRVYRVRWGPYMDAYDPAFQLRVTEYVVENGYRAWFTWHDTLSWYPYGRDIPAHSYPGVPFTAAFLYNLVQAIGVNIPLYDVCFYFPVLMGALTCVIIYFLGKDLGGRTVGLFSAFFMAVSQPFIGRTMAGFFDTENIGIFGMTALSLFYLRSINSDDSMKKRIIYAVFAGLSLGYIFASWGAARYAVGLLIVFLVTSILTQQYERNLLESLGIMMAIGFLISIYIPALGWSYLRSTENIVLVMLMAFLALYEMVRIRLDEGKARYLMVGLLVVVAISVLLLEAVGVIAPITGKFWNVINPRGGSDSPIYLSVAEHHRSNWSNYFRNLGIVVPLGILGTYIALTQRDSRRLFGAVFFMTTMYFAGSMSRLFLILSIPASFMAAIGLKELITPIMKVIVPIVDPRRVRRRGTTQRISRELAVLFSIFIFAAYIPTLMTTAQSSSGPTALASSAFPGRFVDYGYPKDWLQALTWMGDNLPDDAVVASWWDFGYWIEAFANKTTLADGATIRTSHIGKIGRMFMLNYTDSLEIMESLDVTHVLTYATLNPNNPEDEWPYGLNVKWSWMVQIGRLNMSDYINPETFSNKLGQTEVGRQSVFYRLMMNTPDPPFVPVFASDFGFVRVFEVDYDYEDGQT